MKAGLKTLPDELRGGAWPSPARAVRCPVKSGKSALGHTPAEPIERDPRPRLLPTLERGLGLIEGTAAAKAEEGAGYGRWLSLISTSRCQYTARSIRAVG
jgi:hypothetical protein